MSENGVTNGRAELPEGWEWKTVGEVAECKLGKMLDRNKNRGTPRSYLRNVNVRWHQIDPSDLKQMRITDDEVDRYGVRRGDLLICEGGEPGRCAIWESDEVVFFQKALHRVRPGEDVSAEFLLWQMRALTLTGVLETYFTGTTIKHLPGRKLAQVRVAIPPRPEQDRIVACLNADFARINTLEEALDELVALELQLSRSLLWDACRGPLADDGCSPQHWTHLKLGNVAAITSGIGFPKEFQGRSSGDVPFAKVSDVSRAVEEGDGLLSSAANYISEAEAQQLRAPILPAGTVVMAKIGEAVRLNRRALLVLDAAVDNNVMGLTPDQEYVVPRFLWHWTKTLNLEELVRATSVPSVRKSAMEEVPIAVPPVEEQHEIVDALETSLDKAASMSKAIDTVRTDLERLRKTVIHRAFTEGLPSTVLSQP